MATLNLDRPSAMLRHKAGELTLTLGERMLHRSG